MDRKSLPKLAALVPWGPECQGTGNAADVPTIQGIECVFANIIAAALGLAAIILFGMFVFGGFRYLTSGGNPEAVEKARGTLTHAVAGLVILILAFVILLVIAEFTGVTQIREFNVTTN